MAFLLYVLFAPQPKGVDDGIGPMTSAILPWLAFGFVAALATTGFLVGLLFGGITAVTNPIGPRRGPRRPMAG